MSDNSGSGHQQEQVTRGPNGEYILAWRRGFSPDPYGYIKLPASRFEELQIILWLLSAAASGVVGNLTYDYLKQLIQKARKGHKDFMSEWVPVPLEQRSQTPERVTPDPELRDELIELAYDTIARYRSEGPEWNVGQMRPVDVYLTERKTWAIVMRETRTETRMMIEIALAENEARSV
jgi:hypothetical protein